MTSPEISPHNWIVDCHELHAEVLDLDAQEIWQSRLPISQAELDELSLPANWIKVGAGKGVMKAHYFRRSPGADVDGPVSEREIEGVSFIHCAKPPAGGAETPVGDDPRLLRVDKHHSLLFEAGSEVRILRDAEGRDFVQVIASSPAGGGLMQSKAGTSVPEQTAVPPGWKLRTEKLSAETTLHLPNPTQTWFFQNGESFQGPTDIFETTE